MCECDDLNLTVFIVASKRARLYAVKPKAGSKLLWFQFELQPEELEVIEREYLAGAKAPAIDVLETLHSVRRAMARAQGGRRF